MALLKQEAPTPIRRLIAVPQPRVALAGLLPLNDAVLLGGLLIATANLSPLGVAYAVLVYAALGATGTRAPRINPRLGDDAWMLLASVLTPLAVLAPFAGSADAVAGFVMPLAPAAAGSVLVLRGVVYALMRTVRARGFVVEPTLIVGAGAVGREVAVTLQNHPEYGLVPIGFLEGVEDASLPLPVLGRTDDIEPVIHEFAVRRIIVAFGMTREPELVELIRATDHLPAEVHLVPRFFELGFGGNDRDRDDLWGIPLIRLRRSALRTAAWRTKRAFDLVVGSLLFLLTLPLFALAALAVRLSSPGPIFFRQRRIGQHGEVFELLKFRSLRVNDDSETQWSVGIEDRRLTLVGKILRRTSLDELPQFINVLRGEMSLIGPRPERPHFVDRFSGEVHRYRDRHRVPAGLTGWAQVHGLRGDTSIPERVRFDNYYIEHWSLWRDVVITVRTVWLLITGRH